MNIEKTKYLRDLKRILKDNFSIEELEAIAFDLGIDWDVLRGATKIIKAQSLIQYLANRGELANLTTILYEERPHIPLPNIPQSAQQIEDEKALISSGITNLQDYITKLTKLSSIQQMSNLQDESRRILEVQTRVLVAGLNTDEKVILVKFLADMEIFIDYGSINFGSANLRGVDLSGTNLRGAGLYSADLTNANLANADMQGADLTNAILNKAILRGANLANANLHNTNLHRADLNDANLCGANLRTASDLPLRSASLIESGVKYDHTTIWPTYYNLDRSAGGEIQ